MTRNIIFQEHDREYCVPKDWANSLVVSPGVGWWSPGQGPLDARDVNESKILHRTVSIVVSKARHLLIAKKTNDLRPFRELLKSGGTGSSLVLYLQDSETGFLHIESIQMQSLASIRQYLLAHLGPKVDTVGPHSFVVVFDLF